MPRTDNDTWDLATSVGATATMVAAARAVATKSENPLINDQFAEPLVRAVGVDFLSRWAAGELDAANVDTEDSSWKLQQMPDAMAARTRFFDAFFHEATEAGIRQAVILASGLDARAYRLDWPADMTVFEVDQPEVIAFKTQTLSELGASPTTDRRTVAIDLRQDWPPRWLRPVSTAASPPRGSPRVCSVTCRRTPRTGCWTTSPRSAPTAAGWPPKPSRTCPRSIRRRHAS
jgi:O-methyltransferase involved in polyketide biosynthesis